MFIVTSHQTKFENAYINIFAVYLDKWRAIACYPRATNVLLLDLQGKITFYTLSERATVLPTIYNHIFF